MNNGGKQMAGSTKPNNYAFLPAPVRYSQISSGAKILYAEITALSKKSGYCYATNNDFTKLFNIKKSTIENWFKELKTAGYIVVDQVGRFRHCTPVPAEKLPLEKEQPAYYGLLPATVRYSQKISDSAKILYAEIIALSNKSGYCFAQNEYFMKHYKASKRTIINWLTGLKKAGFIKRVFVNGQRHLIPLVKPKDIQKEIDTYLPGTKENRKREEIEEIKPPEQKPPEQKPPEQKPPEQKQPAINNYAEMVDFSGRFKTTPAPAYLSDDDIPF